MNILILNYRDRLHPLAGGAEVHLHRIFGRIALQGHRVLLFTTQFEGGSSQQMLDGIEVFRKGKDWNFNLFCMKKLQKWVDQFHIDVVVEDLNKMPFYAHKFCSCPVLVQMHHLFGMSIFHEASFPVASMVWFAEKTIGWWYKSNKFVVVSPSTKKELHALGIAEKNISVIYNGTEDHYRPQSTLLENSQNAFDPPFILWLGRVRKYKGVHTALEAFAQFHHSFPDYTLKIAGDGPYRKNIESMVESLGLQQKVQVLGRVSSEEKLKLLQDAEFLVQSSKKEGWGLTVIEANACATPAIASDVAGLCDSVIDGQTGLLFEVSNANDLCEKMCQLASDENYRQNMSRACLQHAKQFSWDEAAKQTLTLLESICE